MHILKWLSGIKDFFSKLFPFIWFFMCLNRFNGLHAL